MRGPLSSVLAVLLLACGGPAPAQDWVSVRTDDLLLSVDTSGVLKARNSELVGPPSVSWIWDYKISFMVPEGVQVKKGEPVLGFDLARLQLTLEEKQHERDSMAKQGEKKRIDAAMARRDEELQLAEAEAALRKGLLKADRPTDLSGALELQLARLDLALAQKEVAYRRARAAEARRQDEAELSALREWETRAGEHVREVQTYLGRMMIPAPRAGTVIYVTDRRDTKKKVGDSVSTMDKVVEVADLGEMLARAEVDEVDAGRVALDQRVTLRLDALPDSEFSGRVRTISSTVQPQSAKNPTKVVRLEVALDHTDALRMRPGMRFRGRVETARLPQRLLVPADAVFVTAAGPVAYRQTATGFEAVPLTLGQRNRDVIEVRAGLRAGDRVSRIALGGAP